MTDSVAVFPPSFFVADSNGDPVSGAIAYFYLAGTTTPATVYSDYGLSTALGTSVETNSAGQFVTGAGARTLVYIGPMYYKIKITDADGVILFERDNVSGALVTSGFGGGTGSGLIEVDTVTSDRTLGSGDKGMLFNVDPTGAAVQITLTDAATLGDGWSATVRHDGTANTVNIATVSSQSIKLPGGSTTAGYALIGKGHSVKLVCDGAGFTIADYATPYVGATIPFAKVKSRLAAPPTSPTPGARYILSGTLSGAFASYAVDDIVEADGQGTWIRYQPFAGCGWIVWIEDENLNTQYQASSWVDFSTISEDTLTVPRAIYEHKTAQNTSGGSVTSVTWNTAPWTDEISDTIGCSVSSNQITIPAGTYRISAFRSIAAPANQTTQARIRLYDVTNSAILAYGTTQYQSMPSTTAATSHLELVADVTLSASTVVRVEVYASNSTNWGTVLNLSGISEYWGRLEITDLNGYRGATGPQGATGADGADAGWKYTWSSNTASSDPGSGTIKGNNGTLGSITALYISETDADSNGLSTEIDAWDASTSSAKSTIKIGNSSGMILFRITGANTDNGSWVTLTGSVVASRGSLTGTVRVAPALTGDKGDTGLTGNTGNTGPTGDTGATGPNTGLDYAFNTATSGDPGSGKLLFNSATISSVSQINISETGRNNEALAAVLATWDDSTNTSHYGHLRIFDVSDRTKYLECEITGTLTDAGSYRTIPVTYTAGGTLPSNNAVLAVMFERTGNKGADGLGSGDVVGPSSSVDSRIAAFDGTTGKLLKDGGKTIAEVESAAAASAVSTVRGGASAGYDTLSEIETALAGKAASSHTHTASNVTDFSTAADARIANAVGVSVQGYDADTLKSDTTKSLTAGYSATAYSAGTKSSGTFTPDEADGNFQTATNGGAHTLAPPTNNCSLVIQYTNNGSAGTITTSSFTKVTGSSLTTTNGDDFMCYVTKLNGFSHLHVQALQ